MSDDSLGFILSDTARLLRRAFDARARSIGVTRAQWQVLFVLARSEGESQASVADRLEIESITLGRMIDRLSEAGLVERRPDPKDRRVWRLHLTQAARPIMATLEGLGAALGAEAFAGLTPAEQAELARMLLHVRSNLTQRPAQARVEAAR